MPDTVRIGVIGAGAVSDYHHVPGIEIDPRARLVAVCDRDERLLARRVEDWHVAKTTTDYQKIAADSEIDAVIVATPNFTHLPISLACIEAGKHVMCEKPLGLNHAEALQMFRAARDRGVRHMTAFTYRFAPSMRYLKHLVHAEALGEPRHFRSRRFLELPETDWGWRQSKKLAGAGDLFDMTIHRIDLAQHLVGPIRSLSGAVARFAVRDRTADGRPCEPSDVDDWSSLLVRFENGAVGVLEGSTVMKGYHNNGLGSEWAEINGSEASAVYRLEEPHRVLIGRAGGSLESTPVPEEFLVPAGSPRNPHEGEPSSVFRQDLVFEFVSAIVEGRDAVPGFDAGVSAQRIADAVLESDEKQTWIEIEPFTTNEKNESAQVHKRND